MRRLKRVWRWCRAWWDRAWSYRLDRRRTWWDGGWTHRWYSPDCSFRHIASCVVLTCWARRQAVGMGFASLIHVNHASELFCKIAKSLSRTRQGRLGMGRNEGLLSQIGEPGSARVQKCMYSVGKWVERRWWWCGLGGHTIPAARSVRDSRDCGVGSSVERVRHCAGRTAQRQFVTTCRRRYGLRLTYLTMRLLTCDDCRWLTYCLFLPKRMRLLTCGRGG